jgi:hypothetical protein
MDSENVKILGKIKNRFDDDRIMSRPIWRLVSCMYGKLEGYKF